MKIEAGKHYKSRSGAIYGPMAWNSHYNLWETNGLTWVIGGKFYSGDTKHDKDLIEEVTFCEPVPFSTFPTWEEFDEWYNTDDYIVSGKDVYDFFRNRVQTIEIGQECEFSGDEEDWYKFEFTGYATSTARWKHIRPIQPDPKTDLLDSLRAWQKGDLAFDAMPEVLERAIKALEGEE